MSEERVGGRAGTAAPQGAVCELPNPPLFFPLVKQAECMELRASAIAGAFGFFGGFLRVGVWARLGRNSASYRYGG
jgi:hypothetical protein